MSGCNYFILFLDAFLITLFFLCGLQLFKVCRIMFLHWLHTVVEDKVRERVSAGKEPDK